jgi:hypothetical protein
MTHVVEGLHPEILDMLEDLHLMIGIGLIRCLATTTEIILQVTEAQAREMDAADQETEIAEIVVDTDPQIHLLQVLEMLKSWQKHSESCNEMVNITEMLARKKIRINFFWSQHIMLMLMLIKIPNQHQELSITFCLSILMQQIPYLILLHHFLHTLPLTVCLI